jgi:hypothetical protein
MLEAALALALTLALLLLDDSLGECECECVAAVFLGKGMDRTMSCKDRTCNASGSLAPKTLVRICSVV